MVAKHVNKKFAGNPVFWRLILSYTHLLLLLQPSVLWLSIATFNNDAKPPSKSTLREFDVSRIGPRLGGLPHLERLHGKIERATRSGRPGYPPWRAPHLSCKRDQIKMRDYMDRRVTSPTWGPPPPCKQALIHYVSNVSNAIYASLCAMKLEKLPVNDNDNENASC